MRGREDHQIRLSISPQPFAISDTNLIIRSSDLVDFRVHKSVLALASPFFKDLLSLPQPADWEIVDGHPVVPLSESSELMNSLFSILYPVRVVMPYSYEKVLCFLAIWSAVITNHFLQGTLSTCGVSEVRDGFGAVIYPCRG